PQRDSTGHSPITPVPPDTTHVISNGLSANSPADSPANSSSTHINIRESYLNNIIANHAATLRRLLLPARFPLSPSLIARLVHSASHLEQLGLATELPSIETLGLLLPFLRTLVALRLLIPTGCPPLSGVPAIPRLATLSPTQL